MSKSYYKTEFKKLKSSKYGYRMQVVDELGGNTKWITLNLDSIEVLQEWLEQVKDELITNELDHKE